LENFIEALKDWRHRKNRDRTLGKERDSFISYNRRSDWHRGSGSIHKKNTHRLNTKTGGERGLVEHDLSSWGEERKPVE